jgi:hypothetical protein
LLSQILVSLFFKVKKMPGSLIYSQGGMAKVSYEDSEPRPLIIPQETYEDAVKECEIILKKGNPPSITAPRAIEI